MVNVVGRRCLKRAHKVHSLQPSVRIINRVSSNFGLRDRIHNSKTRSSSDPLQTFGSQLLYDRGILVLLIGAFGNDQFFILHFTF